MYEKHFSFKCKPFDLVPNPDFLYPSTTHKKAISYIDYGIRAKIGFILLSGEVGSGKTTIVRNLIKNLNGSVKLSRINYTKVSSAELIAMINKDFGIKVKGMNKTELLGDLNAFLIDQYAKGLQSILLIDEAQNLSPDLLEEIRLLSNLETDRSKLLQIILVGQPELIKTLMLPELVQLRQRININYHITALSFDEIREYIKHRITVAGNPEAIKLNHDTVQIIYSFSSGIPRLINILCDFALLCACVNGRSTVGLNTVMEVSKDLESNEYWNGAQDKSDTGMDIVGNNKGNADTTDELGIRIDRLEDTVREQLQSNEELKEEIRRLEKGISRIGSTSESSRLAKVFERLVERQVYRIISKMADDEILTAMSDRISKLNDMTASEKKEMKADKQS